MNYKTLSVFFTTWTCLTFCESAWSEVAEQKTKTKEELAIQLDSSDQGVTAPEAAKMNLLDTLRSSGHMVFADLLEMTGVADEMEMLEEYTCYAPRDEGFNPETVEKIRTTPQDESVKQLLKYHFIKAKVPEDTMMISRRIVTMSDRFLVFWVSAGKIRFNEMSDLLKSDIKTDKGLIHSISKVLDDQALYTQPGVNLKDGE
jgi:uncharacterized surface protein with fasciclin (FAS1) repeats